MIPASGTRPGRASAPYRRILVGWDASPDSVAALKAAAALAGSAHGEVVALAVLSNPPGPEHQGEVTAGTRYVLATFESTQPGVQASSGAGVTLHTEEGGDVARSLCGYAQEHGFDLLVLGRHGQEGFFHPKLGHIAHAIAKSSPVPVLLVSTPRSV